MEQPLGPVLFVCTANICRSPMAAKLFLHALKAEPAPYRDLQVLSAGVSAYRGDTASPHSIAALKKVGISCDDHRSQPLSQEMLDDAIAVFCMTESHRSMIDLHYEVAQDKVHLMRQFMADNREPEIPDPYGMSLPLYESCRDSMVEAIPSVLEFVKLLVDDKLAGRR
jgi:protein-tyrosine-phosphatase